MNELTSNNERQIAYWLFVCCALVFAMVILGGVTRLTGSGLSMVEWKPLYGVLPPLSDSDWQSLFEKYQQSPEYKHVNISMDVDGFKDIFWLEYWHRILGRLIGLVFFIPLLWFWLRGKISPPLLPRLITMFVLGGLQGLLGWYMVKSGLVNDPHVSQYRLTAHLLLALLIYGFMLWVALGLLYAPAADKNLAKQPSLPAILAKSGLLLLGLIILTISSGGFVAGLKAGMTYNTFPLMAGQWIPDDILILQPWYLNLFENVITVQFTHRVLAVSTLLGVILFYINTRRYSLPETLKWACNGLLIVAILQVLVGISTLLLQVPVALASTHQAGALLLFTIAILISQQLQQHSSKRQLPKATFNTVSTS